MPVLVALVALVLGIYALVDCLRTSGTHVRGLPVAVWAALIVLLPVVGSLAWLLAGRSADPQGPPRRRGGTAGPVAPRGPDDDDDFLRSLDQTDRGDL